jgi:transcriptional regulator with XRE-family HTH domain
VTPYAGEVSSHESNRARVIPLRPVTSAATPVAGAPAPAVREPLWRHVVGDVLRRERLAQERTLKDVADEARISMPYLSEIERGLKEASSEVLAAAARALGLRLADLLALAQGELSRQAQIRSVGIRASLVSVTSRRDGFFVAGQDVTGTELGASDITLTSASELGVRHGGVRSMPQRGELRLAA